MTDAPKIFIISWLGQHTNAISIASEFLLVTNDVTIVFSDPNAELELDARYQQIKRPDNLFWGDKFKACIDAAAEQPILVVHADCTCENWITLLAAYRKTSKDYPGMGVWAPRVIGTPFDLSVTKIAELSGTSLNICANTDGIVFALSPRIVNRMRKFDFSSNIYGWGIATSFCTYAHISGMLCLVDQNIEVIHPRARGYDSALALHGMKRFLTDQLTVQERVQALLLDRWVNSNRQKAVSTA